MIEFDMSLGFHRFKNSFIECKYIVYETYIHIDKLEVGEEFRSKGLGSLFMEAFIAAAKKNITLTILYHKPLPFYERLGFIIEAAYVVDDDVVYEADLLYEYNKIK